MPGGLAPTRMLTVAVAAELVYQLFGSNMSSPQTGQMNAHARAPTIDGWVKITNIECAAWIAFLCVLDKSFWPALGGGIAGASMYYKYKYAIETGLRSTEPPTEDYQNPEAPYNGNQVYSQA
jgi:hypothetical protein